MKDKLSRIDFQIYKDALEYCRSDLNRYKDVYVLENPNSTHEEKEEALERLVKIIESEEADFHEVNLFVLSILFVLNLVYIIASEFHS